jgi:protein TonB
MMQAPKSAPQRGDIIEYRFDPKKGTSVVFNGTELISNYPGEVFNILLRTWIGPIPPTTWFKEQLLGNSTDSTAEALLETIKPQPKRIALAASWMTPPKPVLPATPEPAPTPTSTPVLAIVEDVVPTQESEQEPAESTAIEGDKIAEAEEPEQAESAEGKEAAEQQTEDAIDFNVAEALAQRDYTPLVVAQIYKSISYPNRAAEKNQQGTVRIAVIIDRSGELLDTVTTQESKYRLLNQAALKAVKKAAPFPTLPAEIKADSFELNLPITFRLK